VRTGKPTYTPKGEISEYHDETGEVVSIKKRTVADLKKDEALSRAPQLEKDIQSFKFDRMTRGRTDN